jgi:hypothetical protein
VQGGLQFSMEWLAFRADKLVAVEQLVAPSVTRWRDGALARLRDAKRRGRMAVVAVAGPYVNRLSGA